MKSRNHKKDHIVQKTPAFAEELKHLLLHLNVLFLEFEKQYQYNTAKLKQVTNSDTM